MQVEIRCVFVEAQRIILVVIAKLRPSAGAPWRAASEDRLGNAKGIAKFTITEAQAQPATAAT
jgi:hypothetical protein